MSMTPLDFLGRWTIKRRIEDALSGQDASFSGVAEISEQGDQWRYSETGQLQIVGAKPMTAERRYIWRADAAGVDVFFEDGRFFHRIALASAANAAHWCDPDQYDVVYDFVDWPIWQSVWIVIGPRKNYTMQSVYQPA